MLDGRGFVDDKDVVAQIIKNARRQRFDHRHQEFPAGKCLALFGEICAVAQRAGEFWLAKPLVCKECPVFQVLRCGGKFTHWSYSDGL